MGLLRQPCRPEAGPCPTGLWRLPHTQTAPAWLRPGRILRSAAVGIINAIVWWWGLASIAGTAWLGLWALRQPHNPERSQ